MKKFKEKILRMWQWLIKTELAIKVADNIIKQGFSIMLLLIGLYWVLTENQNMRYEMQRRDAELRMEINACQNQILQYYKEDKKQTDRVIENATKVMERIERRLD